MDPTTAETEALEVAAWTGLTAAAPPALQAACGFATTRIGATACFTAPGVASNEFNRATGLGVLGPAGDDEIDAVLDHYRSRDLGTAWVQVVGGDAPGGIAERLVQRGASATGRAWVMFGQRPQPMPEPPTALRIARVAPAQAAAIGEVFREAYGFPEGFETLLGALPGRPGWTAYAAFDGDAPVSCAMTFHQGPLAQLSGAATLPAARGRGAQTALIARRVSDLAAEGAEWVQVYTWGPRPGARNPSLDNIERAGFRRLYTRENYLIGPTPA
jgi:ribosomal protein S18 acetylase RimI-like enzyme